MRGLYKFLGVTFFTNRSEQEIENLHTKLDKVTQKTDI